MILCYKLNKAITLLINFQERAPVKKHTPLQIAHILINS